MTANTDDIKYMQRCLKIARQGLGNVSPNPLVGCVIVYDHKIIGEGFHAKYGQAHAEVNAINSVKDKFLLEQSTLYVSLEPCSHYGKTPPCTDLIISHKIPKVIIACTDTNKRVSGKGIEKLIKSGIKVKTGILEKECRELNRRFFTFHEKNRPYIILKWAQTQNGFIDRIRDAGAEIKPNWITSETSRVLVHKWRTEEDAIITGTHTALLDNPALTARDWTGKNPIRILIDRTLKIPIHYKLFNTSAPTLVFNTIKNSTDENLKYLKINFDENILNTILCVLYNENVQSLIVEGGSKLLKSFIDSKLWDEARIFVGPQKFVNGVKAPELNYYKSETKIIGNDKILRIKNNKT